MDPKTKKKTLRLLELDHAQQDGESLYWLWPFKNYKTFCPYLVGSHEEVSEELAKYIRAGFKNFILDIPAEEWDLRSSGVDQVFVRQSGSNEYYLTDASGSAVALTSDAGIIQTSYTYDPFGMTKGFGTPSGNPFQYTGRENDTIDLYYLRARYYGPSLHRFISEDPMMPLDVGVNFYVYALNNPLLFIDPTGLQSWPTNYGQVTGSFNDPRPRGPHNGADIRNRLDAPVYATDGGTVRSLSRDPLGGNQIIIDNNDGSVSGYAHTRPAPHITPGQPVNEGEPIGSSDGSGGVVPHLHLTYRRCRECPREDPLPRLPPPGQRPPPYGAAGGAP